MKNQNNRFLTLLQQFARHHSSRQVFDDFLTVAICMMAPDPPTNSFNHKEWYEKTVKPYSKQEQVLFPYLFHELIEDMENRLRLSMEPDALGEYYQSVLETEQTFFPWDVCAITARVLAECTPDENSASFLDPECGSGRMLTALIAAFGKERIYYGIERDAIRAKMSALNVFLRGAYNAEITCFLLPGNFTISYHITHAPRGISVITAKEDSELWKVTGASDSNVRVVSVSQIKL